MLAPLILLGLVAAASAGGGPPVTPAHILDAMADAGPPAPADGTSANSAPAGGAPTNGAPVGGISANSASTSGIPADGDPVHLAFAGDLSLAIRIGWALEARARGDRAAAGIDADYPFGAVKDRISAADLAVGNFECVASPKGTQRSRFPTLRAPVEAIPAVRDAGFDLVTLANNHTDDFGPEALDDMIARLDEAGLPHIGHGSISPKQQDPFIREVKGLRIGFLAYCDVEPDKAYRDVARARPGVDVLVVFNHWGHEDFVAPLAGQRIFGHGLIDAGVDLVVGAHAHVIQPEEWYRGKLIFYGLGDFAFSGMGMNEPRRIGAFLEVDVTRSGVVARRMYRVHLDDGGAPRWLDPGPVDPDRWP